MEPAGPATGTVLHYRLVEPLGRWGLGESFRARDTRAGRTVALRLAPDTAFPGPGARQAFLDDARRAAALSHPNLAALFDVGEYDGGCCLAIEFATGTPLSRELSGGSANARRAVELAAQVADALADVHARGLVHGDLRPQTVIVTQKGRAKVLEAGLRRWTRGGRLRKEAAASPGTASALVAGYMSPEQAAGREVDARTDIFSLGVMLHEMLSGGHPFAAPRAGDTLAFLRAGTVIPPPVRAGVPPALTAVVGRACAIDPDVRPQSMAAFAADLRRAAAAMDPAPSAEAPLFDGAEGTASRGRHWALALLALVALGVMAWWMMR